MSIKMVLVPADQYFQQNPTANTTPPPPSASTAPASDTTHSTSIPPDVELKLRRQHENPYEPERNLVPVGDLLKTPPGRMKYPAIGEKLDSLLMHLNQNRERVKADKRTGELFFDGRIVPGSDVRRLFTDLVAQNEKTIKPTGWEELRNVLEYTNAPEYVLGQKWGSVNERAAAEKAKRKKEASRKNRPITRASALEGRTPLRKVVKRRFKPSDWQKL